MIQLELVGSKGPSGAPTGLHWLVIGYTDTGVIMHDPNGDPDLVKWILDGEAHFSYILGSQGGNTLVQVMGGLCSVKDNLDPMRVGGSLINEQ